MILDRLWRTKTPPVTATDALTANMEEVPHYPPSLQGLPAVHPARLLQDQRELLDRIRLTSGVGDALWARWYAPVIDRYVAHVHLLPASQSHHHRGMGGLLRHGLEVAFQSLRLLDTVLVGGGETASVRREALPRWQYATFLAGLLHDVAKPITDMTVTDRDGQTWPPFAQSLVDWLAGKDRYYLQWRPGRRDKHILMTAMIAPRFIGAEGLAWIAGDDADHILQSLTESLAGLEYGTNQLRDIATQADAWSVQKDVARLGTMAAPADSDIGIPVERYIIETLRRLCHEGQFGINRVGGEVWHVDNGLYLVWPKAGAAAIMALKRDRMPAIPNDPDRVAQILIERGLAIPAAQGPYHRLMPEALRDPSGREVALHVLRLRDAALLIDPPPPQAPGRVDAGSPPETPAEISAALEPPALRVSPAPPSSPAVASDVPPPPSSPSAKEAPQTPEIPPASDPATTLRGLGAVGEILYAIAEDLARGARPATFAWSVEEGLALRYPDAVTGYGIPAKDVLALCQAPEPLLIPDPVTPAKRVRTVTFGEAEVRVIILRPDIAALMTQVRNGEGARPAAEGKPPPAAQTPPENVPAADPPSDRNRILREAARQSTRVKRRQGFLYLPLTEAVAALQAAWALPPEEAAERLSDLPNGQIENQTYLKIADDKGPRA